MPDILSYEHENMVIKIVACVSLKASYLLVWHKNVIILTSPNVSLLL